MRIYYIIGILALFTLSYLSTAVDTNLTKGQDNSTVLASSQLIYSDDFSGIQPEWGSSPSPNANTAYKDGKLYLTVQDTIAWIVPSKAISPKDFVMEVEATKEEGTDKANYGMIFRQTGKNNFYRFGVTDTGAYNFDKYQDGKFAGTILMKNASAINKGLATNLLKVECRGNLFTLYINGEKQGGITDDTFTSGNIGLFARCPTGKVQIGFDNLKVWAL